MRRTQILASLAVASATFALPVAQANAVAPIRVSASLPASLSASLPLVRLHFSARVNASSLPALRVEPALATKWQQIGPRDVQAVALSTLRPAVQYHFATPSSLACAARCVFQALRPHVASVATNVAWEDQLLAQLHYLPLNFTPTSTALTPSTQVSGTYSWSFPSLPSQLFAQWQVGVDNVVLRGALMNFQSTQNLPTTGVADVVTWNRLIAAANAGQVNTRPYDYVDVAESSPESLTLYVNGQATFHTLVNTGISVAPTATGTYAVYLRYTSQTMSGTNPDGTHYSDPGIPWVSYFNGGDALHGFLRASYGWPQSLGCVEMPYAAAKVVWPFTRIGTLVTVRS
ncbi:MAG: L,D-transpeptidase [Acidobacteriota bacterium]|nr:L,D-transpeptidase [Acidobacteriota bacterium]